MFIIIIFSSALVECGQDWWDALQSGRKDSVGHLKEHSYEYCPWLWLEAVLRSRIIFLQLQLRPLLAYLAQNSKLIHFDVAPALIMEIMRLLAVPDQMPQLGLKGQEGQDWWGELLYNRQEGF
jgi:hypothetical protein